jgi:hypothetical protein
VLLERVAQVTLAGVQDTVARVSGKAWPADRDDPCRLPEPCAEVIGNRLHGWFGDRSAPVLALVPVPMAGLRDCRCPA